VVASFVKSGDEGEGGEVVKGRSEVVRGQGRNEKSVSGLIVGRSKREM
jgi:hypothetical protein